MMPTIWPQKFVPHGVILITAWWFAVSHRPVGAEGGAAAAGKARSRRRKGLLFVNKKKQKNFINLGHAGFAATGPNWQKTAFFKQRPLSLILENDLRAIFF
jgi:hypothetical protein